MTADNAPDIRWRIGFLPQKPPLYEEMTVRGFLEFAARLRGLDQGVSARVDEVIELVEVFDYRNERIDRLSDGYRQRVGIGQAIVHRPALVILDEPTSQLDPAQLRQMRSIIQQLKNDHTVLLSSHNLPEISQTCDRLLVIHQGKLMASGAEDELRSRMGLQPRVRATAFGDQHVLEETIERLKADGLIASIDYEIQGQTLLINATLTQDEPHRLARALIEAGLELTRMQPHLGELESVFLRLTQEPS